MKADPSIKTPAQYIASLPEDRRAIIRTLHLAIRKVAPGLKPGMEYGGLGYGLQRQRYASGREALWPVVGLASQKHHVSLYMCVCDGDGYLPEKFKARLGKVSVGKSCIRFRKLEDLNIEVAMELVRRAAEISAAAKSKASG